MNLQKNIYLPIMAFHVTELHKESISFTLANVFGSFLCVIILFMKQLFGNAPVDIGSILGKGDVYIICASMSISAIYIFYQCKDNKRDWSVWYFILSIINYAISVISYLFVIFIEKPSGAMVVVFALIVFILNFVLTYASSYYANMKADTAVARAAQGKKLEDDLEEALNRG